MTTPENLISRPPHAVYTSSLPLQWGLVCIPWEQKMTLWEPELSSLSSGDGQKPRALSATASSFADNWPERVMRPHLTTGCRDPAGSRWDASGHRPRLRYTCKSLVSSLRPGSRSLVSSVLTEAWHRCCTVTAGLTARTGKNQTSLCHLALGSHVLSIIAELDTWY